jgi:hypothetical protein
VGEEGGGQAPRGAVIVDPEGLSEGGGSDAVAASVQSALARSVGVEQGGAGVHAT